MRPVPALVASLSDDDIDAELAAGLPPEEAAERQAARALRLAALEDEAARRSPVDRAGATDRSRRRAGDPRDLLEAAARVGPVALAGEHLLPVHPALVPLLPDGGLRRGTVIAVGTAGPATGDRVAGATALALALVATASAEGSWTVVVGRPELGLAAAAEAGLALDRLALVAAPPPERWATVVAALVGAVDVVITGPPPTTRAAEVRRLVARARERGSTLIQLTPTVPAVDPATSRAPGAAGDPGPGGRFAPPVRGRPPVHPAAGLGADLVLAVGSARWEGLAAGSGHLRARRVEVGAAGRRAAARPRRVELWLPGPAGSIAAVEPTAEPRMGPGVGPRREPAAGAGTGIKTGIKTGTEGRTGSVRPHRDRGSGGVDPGRPVAELTG